MVTAKTRDWGEPYNGLNTHFGQRAQDLASHNAELDQEISNHSGHAFSRHGYQAGWEQQLIRVVTEITPDQAFDPTGVGAVTREWNPRWVGNSTTESYERHVSTYDATGTVVMAPAGSSSSSPLAFATSAGTESGGFYSPEAQRTALAKAESVAKGIAQFATFNVPGISKDWKPLDRVLVVVDPAPLPGYGIGYRRTSTFVKRTREQMLELIDHFNKRSTWSEVDPATFPPAVSNGVVLLGDGSNQDILKASTQVAFPNLDDLHAYLGVEVFWQKNALVIFKRTAVNAAWTRVTMFPVNWSPVGWAPAAKISGKPWSGKVTTASGAVQTLTVPAWTPK